MRRGLLSSLILLSSYMEIISFIISCNWSFSHHAHHGTNNPEDITCFNFDQLVTLPSFILMTAGFNLLCSNSPLYNFPSKVINKKLCRSAILYTAKEPTYFIETFLDAILNWLVRGEIM